MGDIVNIKTNILNPSFKFKRICVLTNSPPLYNRYNYSNYINYSNTII